MQEDEDSLEYWAERLTELSAMKTDLSQYIIADDVLLLQEQVEHLHCQWEELCLKVSSHLPLHLNPSSLMLSMLKTQHEGLVCGFYLCLVFRVSKASLQGFQIIPLLIGS